MSSTHLCLILHENTCFDSVSLSNSVTASKFVNLSIHAHGSVLRHSIQETTVDSVSNGFLHLEKGQKNGAPTGSKGGCTCWLNESASNEQCHMLTRMCVSVGRLIVCAPVISKQTQAHHERGVLALGALVDVIIPGMAGLLPLHKNMAGGIKKQKTRSMCMPAPSCSDSGAAARTLCVPPHQSLSANLRQSSIKQLVNNNKTEVREEDSQRGIPCFDKAMLACVPRASDS